MIEVAAKTRPITEFVPEKITVGKDILELLSGAMYVDPLNLYREYIQNAADSIDEGLGREHTEIVVSLDPINRRIDITDTGTGVPNSDFVSVMTTIGGSRKRSIPGSRGSRSRRGRSSSWAA